MSFAAAAKSLSLCISEGDADFSLLTLLAQFLPQHSYSSQALVFSRAVSHALLDDSLWCIIARAWIADHIQYLDATDTNTKEYLTILGESQAPKNCVSNFWFEITALWIMVPWVDVKWCTNDDPELFTFNDAMLLFFFSSSISIYMLFYTVLHQLTS